MYKIYVRKKIDEEIKVADKGRLISHEDIIHMSSKFQNLAVEKRSGLPKTCGTVLLADQKALPLTPDQKAELDRRLDAYEIDKDRGRLDTDAVVDISRKV